MNEWFVIGGIAITSVFSYLAARYSSRSAVKAKTVEVDAEAYERADGINVQILQNVDNELKRLSLKVEEQDKALATQASQIKSLTTDVEEVTRIFRVAINFIEQDLLWEANGRRGERPIIPVALRRYINQELMTEHELQRDPHA